MVNWALNNRSEGYREGCSLGMMICIIITTKGISKSELQLLQIQKGITDLDHLCDTKFPGCRERNEVNKNTRAVSLDGMVAKPVRPFTKTFEPNVSISIGDSQPYR